jgi:parallel beta-helix repeat protein
MIFSLLIGVWGQTSSPPEIVFIDFPNQIQADGSKVSGFVGFKDPDGDLARAEFAVVQAKDFQPFTVDLKDLKGVKEGVFEFQIATQTPQRVVLQVVLVDEAGNRSTPKEFWFEAVKPGQPPSQQPVLQVSPTTLSFSGEVGRTPPSQIVQITNAGSGTLNWSASADQSWISLSPASGTAPATMMVSINTTGLEAGRYSGQIMITAPEAQGSPAIVTVSLQLVSSSHQVLRVPEDFSTIQAAIAAARQGDTILIAAGTYRESLTITQSLTLQGQLRDAVIIQGNLQEPTIIIMAQDVTITDLTVTDGSGGTGERGRGGGLHIENSTVTIRNIVIRDNLRHGLLATQGSIVTVRDSQIINNRPSPDGRLGRGITLIQSTATIENNTISSNAESAAILFGSQAQIRGNTVTDNGFGISLFDYEGRASKAVIENNNIMRNSEEGIFMGDSSEAEIINNRITDNKPNAEGKFGDGIEVIDNGQATIHNNIITGNARLGLGLWDNARVIVVGNTISENMADGVNIGYEGYHNEIIQAEFIENVINYNNECGIIIDYDSGIQITGAGNEGRGNKKGRACGAISKLPTNFWKP